MAGIESLMQGPVPGQAPQQPMPGMMPQQGAPTPQGITGQLEKMDPARLLSMYNNPQDMTPKWAVASAYARAVEQQRMLKMAQGQGAMAQNSQMQQQPPVAQQIMSQPVMAAHGGIMHGYAGGGAVAFQTAGAIPPGLLNPDVDEDGLPRGKDEREQIIDYNNKVRAAYEQQMKSKAAAGPRTAAPSMQDIAGMMAGRRQLEQFYKPRDPEAYTPERVGFKVGDIAPGVDAPVTRQGKSGIADLDIGPSMSPVVRGAAPAPGPSASPGGQRQAAAAPEQAMGAPTMKLPDLPPERVAQAGRDIAQSEKLAADQAALVERLSKTSPEVLAARENLQRIMGKAYDPQKKTLEEAKDLFARGIGGNAEALGRMAAAMGGTKRFGQGLAAAAGAGAQFVGEQRKRVESLQDEYNKLQSQLEMTMAQAQYADVIGDDKLKREALTKAEEIKKNLFDTQRSIRKEYFGEQVQQAQGIASLQKAQADLIQAGKPDAATAMLRAYAKNPELVTKFFTAQTEGKAKNPFDMINDNAQRLYSDWLKSTGGMTATEGQRAAMWQQIFDQQIAAAARFGVKVPETGAAPAKGTKDDPIKLG